MVRGSRGSSEGFLGHQSSDWEGGETGISGNFVGRIKGAKCPFDLQFLTWDFSWDAVAGKGFILPRPGSHVVFLELRPDSRVTTGNSGCLFCWPRQVQSSIRVAKESWDLPKPGIEPRSPALRADSLPAEPQGKPRTPGIITRKTGSIN